MKGVRGQKRAARALRYITDNSASPAETTLTMLLTLPYMLGGYKFPMPHLNTRLNFVGIARRSSSKSYYVCDLYWPDFQLAVEYDSDQFHTGANRIANDSKRRNSLTQLGVIVITVTNDQLRSIKEFANLAGQIAVNMNRELRIKNPKFYEAQRILRKQLL
jgi:very-short-patch-repair endonuclease